MTTAVGLCSAYCEVRNFFTWGQEIPTGVTCQADDPTCGISESASFSITQSYSFNIGGTVDTKRSENSSWLLAREETTADILEATFNLVCLFPRPLLSITDIWEGRNVPVLFDNSHVDYRYSRKAYHFALILWLLHVVSQKSDGYFESESLTSPHRVPAFMTSCGSLTTAQVTDQLPSNEAAPPNIPRRQENVQCDISTQKTTPNWCNTSVRLLLLPLLL
jgi:hypothetical protein